MSADSIQNPVGFDLHGLVKVSLIDAEPRDVAAVTRQLGPIRAELDTAADIRIRFVDEIRPASVIRFVGRDQGAFTDDGFLILRAKHKARTRVQIPMDQVGGRCEIICEHGVPAVPLLIPILNLTALTKGVLPLHAAAFDWDGAGVVVTGWSKGGKTETLLGFMLRGARYIADEWCYVAPDGETLFGVPEPVRLWHWQLRQLSALRRHVGWWDRIRLSALAALPRLSDSLPPGLQRSGPGRALRRLAYLLDQQTNVLLPPEQIFGRQIDSTPGTFSHLLLVMSTESPETTIAPMDPDEVAARMKFSLEFERNPFLEYYQMFRFSFPHLSNPHVEKAAEREQTLLHRAFAGKRAFRVEHPYPAEITELFEAIEPELR